MRVSRFEERNGLVCIDRKRMTGAVLFVSVFLVGCSSSDHPMSQMIRLQRDMMQELADVLHRVEDVTDIEPATRHVENLTDQMQRRMAQAGEAGGEIGPRRRGAEEKGEDRRELMHVLHERMLGTYSYCFVAAIVRFGSFRRGDRLF